MVKAVLVRIEVWHPHLICGLPFHFLGAFGRMRSLFRLQYEALAFQSVRNIGFQSVAL